MNRLRLRPFAYAQSDVIVILFDLHDKSTLEYPTIYVPDEEESGHVNEADKKSLMEEIAHFQNTDDEIPYILVGNKDDLDREVTNQQGRVMMTQIQARQYLEVSTVTGDGLSELVEVCCKLGYEHKLTKDSSPSAVVFGGPDGMPNNTKNSCCSLL